GPTSPFNQAWNIVEIPYCTGDVHAGDRVRSYSNGGRILTAHHRGYRNFKYDLAIIKSLFANPAKVAAWGSSAGAFGLDCNLTQLRGAWPGTSMWTMADGEAPYVSLYVPLVPSAAASWGV